MTVLAVAPKVCTCGPCVLAGCTQPPVTVDWWDGVEGQIELHGRDLRRFWDRDARDRAGRSAISERLRQDHLQRVAGRVERETGLRAQRGDEPR
jgi:hypothetical protein